jgi:sorting nexin-1/2
MPAGVVADSDAKSEARSREAAGKGQADADDDDSHDGEDGRMSGTTARDSEDLPRESDEPIDEARLAFQNATIEA